MKLSKIRELSVEKRYKLASEEKNPSTLEMLSKDDDMHVRKAVARNIHTGKKTLEILFLDRNKDVSNEVITNVNYYS